MRSVELVVSVSVDVEVAGPGPLARSTEPSDGFLEKAFLYMRFISLMIKKEKDHSIT